MYRVFEIAVCGLVLLHSLSAGYVVAGPKLICESPIYNFGDREVGEFVEHTFIIKNVGDAVADVKQVEPQCGCAALSMKQESLAPGAETAMILKMSLGNHRGPFHKSLAIVSGDDKKDALNLTFEGTVDSALYVLPERIELGRVDADKEITRKVIVAFAQEEPVKITKIMSDVNTMVSEVKTLKEGGIYRVTIRVNPSKDNSKIDAEVILYTDSPKHPMVGIPIVGSVLVDVAATPNEIVLAGDASESVTRYVVIQSPSGKPFEIREVQCPNDSIKAEVKPLGTVGYRIELSGLTANPELDGKKVLVKTSICSAPILQILLRVRQPAVAKERSQALAIPTRQCVEKASRTQALPTPQSVEEIIRCDERKADCGEVRLGQPAEHTFRLFNTSNETRHITEVLPGCNSAKVVRFSKDIAAQSSGEVTVSLDTTGCPGTRRASVVIVTDAAPRSNINTWVSCKVLPAIEIKPWNLQFAMQEPASGIQSQSVEVIGLYPDEEIALGDVQPNESVISVAKETIDEHKRFRLNVSVGKDMPAGVTHAYVDVHLEGSAQKNVRVPITITNEVKMKAEPSSLELPADENALQTVEFTIKGLDDSSLEVNKVELADTVLNVVSEQVANNTVVVRLKDMKVTQDLNFKHIRVSTNRGELRVPITIRCESCKKASETKTSDSSSVSPKT